MILIIQNSHYYWVGGPPKVDVQTGESVRQNRPGGERLVQPVTNPLSNVEIGTQVVQSQLAICRLGYGPPLQKQTLPIRTLNTKLLNSKSLNRPLLNREVLSLRLSPIWFAWRSYQNLRRERQK